MKRLLVVSPHFPPVNAPDMQRVRMALPHYLAAGYGVTVLAAEPDEGAQAIEPELAAALPPGAEIIRLTPLPLRWTRCIGLSTLGLRFLPALWREGSRQLATGQFDAVFFSNTQFITMPLGRIWLARFGLPYVIDLQDPWLSDFYDRPGAPPPPGGWKYRLSHALSWALEGWTLRRAAAVMSVSHGYLDTLRKRYPWFGDKKAEVIPFGVSLADFDASEKISFRIEPAPDAAIKTIVYTGRLGPDMRGLLAVFFRGLAGLKQRNVRMEFWGTSYADKARQKTVACEVADECGVKDLVKEHPGRIAYLETFARLRAADAILLLGSDDRDYSPSKVYPVLASGRPVLAVVPVGSILESVLVAEEFPNFLRVAADGTTTPVIADFLARWENEPEAFTLAPVARTRFLARHEAGVVAQRHLKLIFGTS